MKDFIFAIAVFSLITPADAAELRLEVQSPPSVGFAFDTCGTNSCALTLDIPKLDPGGPITEDFKRGACYTARLLHPEAIKQTIWFYSPIEMKCEPAP